MANLTSGLVGFFVSTFVIVLFGEIMPQAMCSRHALKVGAMSVPLVKVIIVIMYPVAKPIRFFEAEHANLTLLGKIGTLKLNSYFPRQHLCASTPHYLPQHAFGFHAGRRAWNNPQFYGTNQNAPATC
jgi:hypothetical protein